MAEDENALSNAKSLLAHEAASVTMRTINDRPIIANSGGATLVQRMEERLSDLHSSVEKLATETADLRAEHVKLSERIEKFEKLGLHKHFMDVRELSFLTYLRDHVRGHSEVFETVIEDLDRTVVHGGNCVADAVMIQKRYPSKVADFNEVYGVGPDKVEELCKFHIPPHERIIIAILIVMQNIVANGYDDVIEVLDIVGGLHLDGLRLETASIMIFQEITSLVNEGQYDAARDTCRSFPRAVQATE